MIVIFDLDDTLYSRTEQLKDNYSEEDLSKITLFPGVKGFLENPSFKKILVTKETEEGLQNKKIDQLKIRNFFNKIFICSKNEEKKEHFTKVLKENPYQKIFVVGDRIDSEIRFGNELGLITILIKSGKYQGLVPKDLMEKPTYTVNDFTNIKKIIKK